MLALVIIILRQQDSASFAAPTQTMVAWMRTQTTITYGQMKTTALVFTLGAQNQGQITTILRLTKTMVRVLPVIQMAILTAAVLTPQLTIMMLQLQ
jgi:mannitol/fructose-specific phosphotransferase system IIA component